MIFPVSVPYRGATFLNRQMTQLKQILNVSVPYRGATFLNNLRSYLKSMSFQFPSPIGELHFSICHSVYDTSILAPRFRPLSGSYISQLQFAHSDITCAGVSVPYRGATFLNQYGLRLSREIHSFRPLSGSYISQ